MIERRGPSLRVKGAISQSNAKALLETGLQQLVPGLEEIDFSEAREVDSFAVSVLLEWLRQAKNQNLQLRVANMPENMKSLAALYGVLGLIPGANQG